MLRLIVCCIVFLGAMPASIHAEPATTIDNAILDFQFQDFQAAEEKFRYLLAQEPESVSIHYYLGLTLQQTKHYDEAIQHLEIAAKSEQAPDSIRSDLAELYVQAGYPHKATSFYKERYLADVLNGQVAMQYAGVLNASGSDDEALKIYNYVIAHPSAELNQARYEKGVILSNLGSYGSAVEMFHQVDKSSPYDAGAKAYLESLEPVVKPVSAYVSTELFYETNPNAASSATLTGSSSQTTEQGSNGLTAIIKLDTKKWELNPHWRFGLGYLYYGVFYGQDSAKSNDFLGHFLTPSVQWQINTTAYLSWQLDLQSFNYNHQKLSTNKGLTMEIHQRYDSGSVSLALAGINKAYTETYSSEGNEVSLAYLDARATTVTLKGTKNIGANSISMGYTFNRENTSNDQTLELYQKASDSQNIKQAISLADSFAFAGNWSVSLNGSYAKTDYGNVQSGTAFPSVSGKKVDVKTTVAGLRVAYVFTNLNDWTVSTGAEKTHNVSDATELAYDNIHYGLDFAGSF
ncbi:MAG: tetratricopeptide repeat protein [Ghiorsea sp.]